MNIFVPSARAGHPRVGVTSPVRVEVGGRIICGASTRVSTALWEAGADAYQLPPAVKRVDGRLEVDYERLEAQVSDIDALVLPGGPDPDPSLSGLENYPGEEYAGRLQDDLEIAILDIAKEEQKPILGICRGFEIINVAARGDLELVDGHHRGGPITMIRIETVERTALGRLFQVAQVPCSHKLRIKTLGRGLVAMAHSDGGVIHAIGDPDQEFLIGVLYHPEFEEDSPILREFVAAATRSRARRR